jgi:hypothetical protein
MPALEASNATMPIRPSSTIPYWLVPCVTGLLSIGLASACGSSRIPSESDSGLDASTLPSTGDRDAGSSDRDVGANVNACDRVAICADDDGCCPDKCHAGSDTDCAPVCGNGERETPETCDGNCRDSCDDGIACTVNTGRGSPDTCDVVCEALPIEECVSGDGCCPSGCTGTDEDCGAVCGNGTAEEGETCDGSDCPSACDDDNACTVDSLRGDAAQCSAVCAFVAVTACTSDDGCCPPGCNANTDSDCNPVCGNGALERGETCEGDCPTSCDDGNACTADRLQGAVDACSAVCTSVSIDTCTSGDGCCPSGCNKSLDFDCDAICGNGVPEPGESCDGNCPTACDDRNACTVDRLQGEAGKCSAACAFVAVTACTAGDGCCPSGCNADNDADCFALCGNGVTEHGETCDGNCPASCDDGKACTVDSLHGSAAECDALCAHATIQQCVTGDGCCASGCTSDTDADCLTACGASAQDCTSWTIPERAEPICDGSQCSFRCRAGTTPSAGSCLLNAGASCSADAQCLGRCIAGTCSPASSSGGTCDLGQDDDCAGELVCASGVCRETLCGSLAGTLEANTQYQVDCDVHVAASSTLVIEEGVRLRFARGTRLVVDGTLVAQGGAQRRVRFESGVDTPKAGDFRGLEMNAGASVELLHVEIAHAQNGMTVNGGDLALEHAEVHDCTGSGVYIGFQPAEVGLSDIHVHHCGTGLYVGRSALIERAELSYNAVGANFLHWTDVSPTLRSAHVHHNQRGLVMDYAGLNCPVIEDTRFEQNQVGLFWSESRDCTFRRLRFRDNQTWNVQAEGNRGATLSVVDSYWGTTDLVAIERTLLDVDDNPDLGDVVVTPFRVSPDGPSSSPPSVGLRVMPQLGPVPFDTVLTATATAAAGQSISHYEWDFDGDGAVDLTGPNAVIQHRYAVAGSFRTRVWAVDGAGLRGSAEQLVVATTSGTPIRLCGSLQGEIEIPAGTELRIDCDVHVPADSTLVIEEGVRLRFARGTRLVVDGTLVAQGGAQRRVRFESGVDTPKAGDFRGLEMNAGASVELLHVEIAHAQNGMTVNGGDLALEHAEVHDCTGSGVYIGFQPAEVGLSDIHVHHCGTGLYVGRSALIERAELSYNAVGANFLHWTDVSPTLRSAHVHHNQRGLVMDYAGLNCPVIEDTRFEQNQVGLFWSESRDCTFRRLRFRDNQTWNVQAEGNRGATLSVVDSYWGTTDLVAIERTILDRDDNPDLGDVVVSLGDVVAPACGNGAVEQGETCDGNCPTSCQKPDACTSATLTGSAQACSARCSYAAISACTSGDGCCPDGCSNANDKDCAPAAPRCGDGKVDPGETCDGNCPTSCQKPDACTTAVLTGSAQGCTAACTYTETTACLSLDGCCPAGCTATLDGDCERTAPAAGACNYKAEHGYCAQYVGGVYTPGSVRDTCPNNYVSECPNAGLLGRCALAEGTPNAVVSYYYTQSLTPAQCREAGGRWY